MATFYNQATLTYNGRAVNSNITVGEIVDAVSMTKSVISESYRVGDTVTVHVNERVSYPVEIRAIKKGEDDASLSITQ